jgi:hypothetical protein
MGEEVVKYDNVLVEDAPFDVDLDTLLGDMDSGSLANFQEDDTKVDFPHIKVSTKKFLDALKISNILSQGSGRDVVARAVGIQVQNGKLAVLLSDFEMFVKKELELINTDNFLEDFISINLPIISKLVKACPSVLTIYKNGDKFYIRLVGGDIVLETITVGKDQLEQPEIETKKLKSIGVLNTTEVMKAIKNLFVIAAVAVTPAQRRVYFKDKEISSTFLYCSARYKSAQTLPEFDLSIKDIKILYILSQGTESPELKVSMHKKRVMISGTDFSYGFEKSEFKPSQQMIDSMDGILSEEPLNILANQLNISAELATSLVYSLARMDFNYTSEGKIEFIMKTKRNDGNFVLVSEGNSKHTPFEKPVSIQSGLLKDLLKVFSQQTSLSMTLTPNGVGLSCGNYDAVLYTENSSTVSSD